MIRFKVYNQAKPAESLSLTGTYMFAQDEIPVRSQLQYANGELIGTRNSETAAGVATVWPVKDFGEILLQTTRLPERSAAYILNVELARARLLKISQKRADWGMTDTNLTEDNHQLIDQSLDAFVDALCFLDQPEKASVHADKSLTLAMRAGEAMSLAHAKFFLDRRTATQGFGRHSFGCTFDPKRIQDESYLKAIQDNFHFVTLPISWRQIEPKEQQQDFSLIDECVRWLTKHRIAIKAGPLISFAPTMLPDWLSIFENDFEQVREMAFEYVTAVVERYQQKVQAWDVVSGLNANNFFKFSFDQIVEMTRSATMAAKKAAHRALILVEITEPWGEYYATNPRAIPPLVYADVICQSGVRFDGFGIKIRFGRGAGGMQTRDFLDISSLLDRFALFGKQVHLSSVGVPSLPDPRDRIGNLGNPGYWHEPWSEAVQAEWLRCLYSIALSKPFVETITWQDLLDDEESVLQNGGLLRKDYTQKPAFDALAHLKRELIHTNHKTAKE